MEFILHPWRLPVSTVSALINHEQEKSIDRHRVENHMLTEKLGAAPFSLVPVRKPIFRVQNSRPVILNEVKNLFNLLTRLR